MSTFSRRSASTRSAGPQAIAIETGRIGLGDFLKWAGAADTGGRAKQMVQGGAVKVNGAVERRRGRQLASGDRVAVAGKEYLVVAR
ncbi:MAG TPA: RNA-binding S4 domain-containing protein [bacterium]|nr:RNA-binding S4 domain-containing protein [bacterium]